MSATSRPLSDRSVAGPAVVRRNALLAALPPGELASFGRLEWLTLEPSEVIFDLGTRYRIIRSEFDRLLGNTISLNPLRDMQSAAAGRSTLGSAGERGSVAGKGTGESDV